MASMSPLFYASIARRTNSTFSCDIARAVSRRGTTRGRSPTGCRTGPEKASAGRETGAEWPGEGPPSELREDRRRQALALCTGYGDFICAAQARRLETGTAKVECVIQ